MVPVTSYVAPSPSMKPSPFSTLNSETVTPSLVSAVPSYSLVSVAEVMATLRLFTVMVSELVKY